MIREFWDKQGRLLILLDPAANTPKLHAFLKDLGVTVNNDRLIAMGGVDFRLSEDAGSIWMLAVHERFQSLGIGTQLIAALQQKIIDHGRPIARMLVEHDNPRARALYERLGYSERGPALDSWPVAGGKTYVTACTIMERRLAEIHGDDTVPH